MTRSPVQYLFVLLTLLTLSAPAAAQTLTLEECRISAGPGHPGIKARCGTMLRPENPADPDSAEIEVRVAVVAALIGGWIGHVIGLSGVPDSTGLSGCLVQWTPSVDSAYPVSKRTKAVPAVYHIR